MEKLLDINPEFVHEKTVPLGGAPTRDGPNQARANSSTVHAHFARDSRACMGIALRQPGQTAHE